MGLAPGWRSFPKGRTSCRSSRPHAEEDGMSHFDALFERLSLPLGDRYDLPGSETRFPDGAQYRVEIPSTEGPRALRAVVEAAQQYRVPVHRVSQGSGIMMLTDEELREM